MRVLYVMPGLEENGGVRNAMQVADALNSLGVGVTIFSVRSRAEAELPLAMVTRPLVFGADAPTRLRHNPGLVSRLRRAASAAEVIVSTYEVGLGLMAAALGGLCSGRPVIAWVQNNLAASVPLIPFRDRMAARVLYPRLDGVLCVAEDLAVTLRAVTRRPPRRLGWAENGIDAPRVKAAALDTPQVEITNEPTIVGVGRLSRQKGFDLLIRAHAAVLATGRRHRLLLLGEGSDRPSLEALAVGLGVQNSVGLPGHCSNPHSVLARACLFCLPSRYEGLPLVLLEGLALGVPIIAADCIAGPRRVLQDGVYGELVPPESPEALAQAIGRHLDEPRRLRRMAAEGAQWAERFTVLRCAERHRTFYRAVLKDRSGGTAQEVE